MERLKHKLINQTLRRQRVRSIVRGSSERPRLSVHISNNHVTAQIIDDHTQRTLVYATTVGGKVSGTLTERAAKVGEDIAQKAKEVKVRKVVFDRGGKLYHGRVKALADAARNAGLEF